MHAFFGRSSPQIRIYPKVFLENTPGLGLWTGSRPLSTVLLIEVSSKSWSRHSSSPNLCNLYSYSPSLPKSCFQYQVYVYQEVLLLCPPCTILPLWAEWLLLLFIFCLLSPLNVKWKLHQDRNFMCFFHW